MKKLDPSEFWFEDILKSNAATHLCLDHELTRERIKRGSLKVDHSSQLEYLSRPYVDLPLSDKKDKESYYEIRNGIRQYGDPSDEHPDEKTETRWHRGMFISKWAVLKGMLWPMWVLVDRFRSEFKEMGEAIDSAEKEFKSMKVSKKEHEKRVRKWEDMMNQRFGTLRWEGFDDHEYRAFNIDWAKSKENLIKEFTDFIDEAYETHGQAPPSLPGGGDPYRKMRADLVHLARARLWKFHAGNIAKCHLSVGESTSEYAKKIQASERTYSNSLDRIIELCESEEYQW